MKYLRFLSMCVISLNMVMASQMSRESSTRDEDAYEPYRAPYVTPVNYAPFDEIEIEMKNDDGESQVDALGAAMAGMSVSRTSTPRLVTPRQDAYVVLDASQQTSAVEMRESCQDMVAHLKAFFNPVLCLDFRKEGGEAASCCGCCANVPSWVAERLFIWAEVFTYDLILMVEEDLKDGKLDGKGPDGTISYQQMIVKHLGLKYDPLFHKLFKPSSRTTAQKIAGNVAARLSDAASSIGEHGVTPGAALGFFERQIHSYMKKFKRLLSKHLIRAFVKNMEDELSNGQIDGCDKNGEAIDWKYRTEQAVREALPSIATGSFDQSDPYDYVGMKE